MRTCKESLITEIHLKSNAPYFTFYIFHISVYFIHEISINMLCLLILLRLFSYQVVRIKLKMRLYVVTVKGLLYIEMIWAYDRGKGEIVFCVRNTHV